jgi:hypothetical protein
MSSEKLGGFLREVSNWPWDEFCRAEADKKYTSNQAIIFALIRNAANQKLNAIQMSLNRLDGKLATPVKVEYPSIYYLYPNATGTDYSATHPITGVDHSSGVDATAVTTMEDGVITDITIIEPEDLGAHEKPERDLATMTLRETLTEMADYPRELPDAILKLAQQTEEWIRNANSMPDEIPKVKSVVAAALLTLAQTRNMNAITEVFDQIDGKLVETIKVLGEDIFINNYAPIAPPGARKNADGVYQLQAVDAENTWARKLGKADV